ncbi:MAG: hypothetical protein AB8I08_00955 [Sandaracinaceae bacterium]
MDASQKKLAGRVTGGCGCAFLVLVGLWCCFLLYVGIEGRGNDEEASLMLGAVTCLCSLPVMALTGVGLFFGLRSDPPE